MKCLYCYQESDQEFHAKCSQKFFGSAVPPEIPYSEEDLLKLAEQMIKGRATVTGVQPKLSLHIQKPDNQTAKLTIVGLWGQYILKPQSPVWPELPQIEDLTMHLAKRAKIKTADHSLVRLGSGELSYVTRRMDRKNGKKIHMEDMCQLTGRLTEDKYKSSHERIAKEIKLKSAIPGLDLVRYYELVLFSFLTGNADMHLKNFSLIMNAKGFHELAPAYDLVASALVVEGDDEELALTLAGKRKSLRRSDFELAMKTSGIPEKTINNMLTKFSKFLEPWMGFVDQSFLSEEMKEEYKTLLTQKHKQVYG